MLVIFEYNIYYREKNYFGVWLNVSFGQNTGENGRKVTPT